MILLKVGQVVGVLVMAAGVAACQMGSIENTPILMIIGGLLYGGCRLAAWFSSKNP